MRYCWARNGQFSPNKNFLEEIINIMFIYLLVPFIVPHVKKFLAEDLDQ